VTVTVKSAAATKAIVGPMLMQQILIQVIGGVTLKCKALSEKDQFGNNVVTTTTAIGIEHVATVVNIKAVNGKVEMYANLHHSTCYNNSFFLLLKIVQIKT
jgi:hypothetical protein